MRPIKTLFFLLVISVCGLTVVLDRLFYGNLIFIPEHSGAWDQFRWYTFEYHQRRLEKSRQNSNEKFVLILGSSIAKYSVHKKELARMLSARMKIPVSVELMVHASMLPTDISFYISRISALRPDIIVYITNPADFDLERYRPPWEVGPEYSDLEEHNYLMIRHPMLIFYPFRFAMKHKKTLSTEKTLSLFIRGSLFALRYKDEWIDPLIFNYHSRYHQTKSYLHYQGKPIPEGLWRNGQTGACFSIDTNDLNSDRHILMQIFHRLVKLPEFKIKFFSFNTKRYKKMPSSKPALSCKIPQNSILLSTLIPTKRGWQKVDTGGKEKPPDHNRIFILLSHVISQNGKIIAVNNKMASHAGRGIRLPGNFGLKRHRSNNYHKRYRSLEDERLRHLDRSNYSHDFESRIQPNNWALNKNFALHQFNRLRLAKYYLNWYEFSEIYQIRELKNFVAQISKESILLIINNPENPITLEEYEDTKWYRGYLRFMNSLEKKYSNVYFRDLHNHAKFNSFSDAHHLTFFGAQKMAPYYAKEIEKILKQ